MSEYTKYLDFFIKTNQFDHYNELKLSVLTPGHIEYTMEIKEKHLSSPGLCHGGVISSMMDAVLGCATLTHAFTQNCLCSTVELKLNFIAPVHLGDTLRGIGKIDHAGKSLVISSGEIFDLKTSKLVAKGMGTFNLYPIEKNNYMKGI